MAVVLFTTGSPCLGPLFTQPQDGQKHSGWGEEGEEEVHLVVDDEPLRVDAVMQGQAGGHFPGSTKATWSAEAAQRSRFTWRENQLLLYVDL